MGSLPTVHYLDGGPSTPRGCRQLSRALHFARLHNSLIISSGQSLLFCQQQQSSREACQHRQTALDQAARRRERPCAAPPRIPTCRFRGVRTLRLHGYTRAEGKGGPAFQTTTQETGEATSA